MTLAVSAPAVPDLLGTAPADLIDPAVDAPVATRDVAVRRAERIRTGIAGYAAMRQDIADAYAERDWQALDYGSWHEYVREEFGEELSALAREDRRAAVSDLRATGMSTRQIAQATGVGQTQIRRDLNEVSPNGSPVIVTGSDGKQHPASRPSTPEPAGTGEPVRESPAATQPPATAAGDPTPDPHAEGDARRDAELDAAMADTAVRFRRNFAAAAVKAGEITTFDPDRIAEIYAGNWDRDVGDLLNTLDAWTARVRQAHQARQGLRLVTGGTA